MAIVVKNKNTFLTLCFDEKCTSRRCQSVPPGWKPATCVPKGWEAAQAMPLEQTHCDPSPRSDCSFDSAGQTLGNRSMSLPDPCARGGDGSHTDSHDWAEVDASLWASVDGPSEESSSLQFTCKTPSLSRSSSGYFLQEHDVETSLPMQFACMTPTSSRSNSPAKAMFCSSCLSQESLPMSPAVVSGSFMNSCTPELCLPSPREDDCKTLMQQPAEELEEPENEPETCVEAGGVDAYATKTRLKSAPAFQPVPKDGKVDALVPNFQPVQAHASMHAVVPIFQPVQVHAIVPTFQPVQTDTRLHAVMPAFKPAQDTSTGMSAVVSCLHIALASCGRLRDIKIERDPWGKSATWLSSELHHGPSDSSRSYDVINLARQALEAITERLPSLALLSIRVQKEDWGYSLRSSVACLPAGAEGSMCWDMLQKGHCPRHGQCRWYHPQRSDIGKVKVTVRYSADPTEE